MPIFTQFLSGETEFVHLIYDHIYRKWKQRKVRQLAQDHTKLRLKVQRC